MIRRTSLIPILAGLVILGGAGYALKTYAQPAISRATFYLATVPLAGSQSTLRVVTNQTPNRTEIGCETDRLSTTTVNGLRFVGSATTVNPSITAIPCTGGDTNIGITLTPAGTGSMTFGGVKAMTQFFPAALHCQVTSTSTLPVVVRVAANDYGLRRTGGAAETINYGCTIPLVLSTTASKGMRLDSFSIVHQIVTLALTSNTFNALATTTYVNNIANAVAAHGGAITITLPTATQANPYVTAGTIGTAAFVNTTATQVSMDWTAILQNTSVYTVYGVVGNYSQALY